MHNRALIQNTVHTNIVETANVVRYANISDIRQSDGGDALFEDCQHISAKFRSVNSCKSKILETGNFRFFRLLVIPVFVISLQI